MCLEWSSNFIEKHKRGVFESLKHFSFNVLQNKPRTHPANCVVVHIHLRHLSLSSDGVGFCHPHHHYPLLAIDLDPCPSFFLWVLEHPLHRIICTHAGVAHTLVSVNTPPTWLVTIVTPGNLIDCIWIQQKTGILFGIRHFLAFLKIQPRYILECFHYILCKLYFR